MVEEIYDKYRHLELTIESWLYNVDDPSVMIQQTTNIFPYEGDFPFTNDRKKWRSEITEFIIARLTQTMINEFGNRGICTQANETQCSPSINWSYEILDATFHYKQDEEKIRKEIEEKFKEQIQKYKEERDQELLKAQQKKEKADKKKKAKLEKERKKAEKRPKPEKREVPVTIDEEPTTITIKKELTTMDVIQISRLAKSITKLEKQKEEQEKYLNITLGAIERIEESEKIELMLGQIVTRDRWLDEISRTNRKIEKQNEAIEKIRMSGGA